MNKQIKNSITYNSCGQENPNKDINCNNCGNVFNKNNNKKRIIKIIGFIIIILIILSTISGILIYKKISYEKQQYKNHLEEYSQK